MTSNLTLLTNLNDLLMIQNDQGSTEQVLIETNVGALPDYEYAFDGQYFYFKFPPHVWSGHEFKYHIADPDLSKMRHDFVANLATDRTDIKFRDIDPNYDVFHEELYHNMSPDAYLKDKRSILELGTSATPEEAFLRRQYMLKEVKYRPHLASALLSELYIMIVSPSSVCTNMSLSQSQLDEMSIRLRLGLSFEADVIKDLGRDIFSSKDKSEGMRSVEALLSSLDLGKSWPSSPEFGDEIFKFCSSPITDEEKARARTIIAGCFKKSKNVKPRDPESIGRYLATFDATATRDNQKRIIPFPLIRAWRQVTPVDPSIFPLIKPNELSADSFMSGIWSAASIHLTANSVYYSEEASIREMWDAAKPKHQWKKRQIFKFSPNDEQMELAALRGIRAKKMEEASKRNPGKYAEFDSHREESHLSFHPSTDTKDIEKLLDSKDWSKYYEVPELHESYLKLIREAKTIAQGNDSNSSFPTSPEIWSKFIASSDLVNYADFISSICQELSLCMKHYCDQDEYFVKYLRYYKAILIIKTTGSHVFCSIACLSSESEKFETGRIGPTIYNSQSYFVSDFFSCTEVALEHYIKSGPYMAAISAHLISNFQIDTFSASQKEFFDPKINVQYWQTLKLIFLIFLNNKIDLEELITSQRYLFMNLMDDVNPDPSKFIERLPEVLRSRLTVLLLNKTLRIMERHETIRITKTFSVHSQGDDLITYHNIPSIFCSGALTLEQKINEFYYGYVVSKEKGRASMKSFQICKKIYKEELKYLKRTGPIIGKLDEPSPHRTDGACLKFVIDIFQKLLSHRMGPNWKNLISESILRNFSTSNFSDLATLKASARSHVSSLVNAEPLMDDLDPTSVKELLKKLKEDNEAEFSRRPKMLEALTLLCYEYSESQGREPSMLFELVPYCLRSLEEKGTFDSDLFPKSQHGGDREIHVLEVKARVLQFFLETISRTICTYFPTETITHPESKDSTVPKHYADANISYDRFVTMCKSADATRWCQNHHVSRFAVMLISLTPRLYHPFIFRVLRLWVLKRITLPMDLIAVFLRNKDTKTGTKEFEQMRSAFYSGDLPFTGPCSHQIIVSSGMFQGILHLTSSLYHTMLQEVCRNLTIGLMQEMHGVTPIISIMQSSDDTAMMISVPMSKPRSEIVAMLYTMLSWKEHFSSYLSIYPSWAKSAIGILNLVEYNSEWRLRQKVIKPTSRWLFAALNTSMVSTFSERFRISSNVLTQCMEGGASTFECALVQIAQAWMHYKIIGLDTNPIFSRFSDVLMQTPDPSLGFHPLDPDLVSGITGFDFSLYLLCRELARRKGRVPIESITNESEIESSDLPDKSKSKQLGSVRLDFTRISIWESMVKRIKIPTMEDLIKASQADPEIVFGKQKDWANDRLNIALKMYSPGVKQSLSGHQPLLRMFVSSAYVLNRDCMRARDFPDKSSLLAIAESRLQKACGTGANESSLRRFFPHHEEYSSLIEYLQEFRRTAAIVESSLTRRSKHKVMVFASDEDEFSLVQLCRRKWFGHNWLVPIGKTTFDVHWQRCLIRYDFLRDTVKETCDVLELNVIELRFFLESIGSKGRKIMLTDTPAKGRSLNAIISRIYWPGKKLRSAAEGQRTKGIEALKSNLFSISAFPFSESVATRKMQNLIGGCKTLLAMPDEIPREGQTLKIFHDYLQGIPRANLLVRIAKMKKGRVGFFSVRQQYDRNTRGYGGFGQWRGLVDGRPTVIEIYDNYVIKVILRNTIDLDGMAYGINQLLREWRVKMPPTVPQSVDHMYMSASGKIRWSVSVPQNHVPVILDPYLVQGISDKVSDSIWRMEVGPASIRLVFQPDNEARKFTLLSESLSNRDWDPALPYMPIGDKLHEHFYKDEPILLTDLQVWLERILDTSWKKRQMQINRMSASRFVLNYDKIKLQNFFLRYVFRLEAEQTSLDDILNKGMQKMKVESNIEKEEIDQLMVEMRATDIAAASSSFLMNFMKNARSYASDDEEDAESEQEDVIEVEDEELEMNQINTLIAVDNFDYRTLDKFLSEMRESNISNYELLDMLAVMNYGMSSTNKALKYVNAIAHASIGEGSLIEALKDENQKWDGVLGKICSIINQADRYIGHGPEEDTVSSHEHSDFSSAKTDGSDHVSMRRLEEQMQEVEKYLLNSQGPLKDYMYAMKMDIHRKMDELGAEMTYPVRQIDLSDILKNQFLDVTAAFLVKEGKIEDSELLKMDLMGSSPYMVGLLIESLMALKQRENFSDEMYSRYVAAIKNPAFTVEVADMIAEIFKLKIRFVLRGQTIYHVQETTGKNNTSTAVYYHILEGKMARA